MEFTIENLKTLSHAFDRSINPNGDLYPDYLNESADAFIDFIEEKIADGTIEYILFNGDE